VVVVVAELAQLVAQDRQVLAATVVLGLIHLTALIMLAAAAVRHAAAPAGAGEAVVVVREVLIPLLELREQLTLAAAAAGQQIQERASAAQAVQVSLFFPMQLPQAHQSHSTPQLHL
jgi:hypothetical protein